MYRGSFLSKRPFIMCEFILCHVGVMLVCFISSLWFYLYLCREQIRTAVVASCAAIKNYNTR